MNFKVGQVVTYIAGPSMDPRNGGPSYFGIGNRDEKLIGKEIEIIGLRDAYNPDKDWVKGRFLDTDEIGHFITGIFTPASLVVKRSKHNFIARKPLNSPEEVN